MTDTTPTETDTRHTFESQTSDTTPSVDKTDTDTTVKVLKKDQMITILGIKNNKTKGAGRGRTGGKPLELCDTTNVCARPQCQATSCRFQCSRCELVWYCKAECQRLDWAYHKAKCKTKEKRAQEKAAGMALVVASLKGWMPLVRSMLERGADVNFVTVDGFTALYAASCDGQWEIVDVLNRAYNAFTAHTCCWKELGKKEYTRFFAGSRRSV